jgi:XTP/dITP diphosphohydrolase
VIRLLIATRNRHKVGEIQAILGPNFDCRTLNEFPDAPAVVEDEPDFAGNARKKAWELARWLNAFAASQASGGQYVLADDSGLQVDALGGAPGVHSARFAALDSGVPGNSSDADNNAKLLRLLKDVPMEKRSARFCCVIALVATSGDSAAKARLFDGTCEGRIEFAPSGGGGFGYDPLFTPNDCAETFAQLGEATKNQISHRAKALAELKEFFLRSA